MHVASLTFPCVWGFHAYVWNEIRLFSLINFSHVDLIIGLAKRTLEARGKSFSPTEAYFGWHILVSSICSGGTWAIMGPWVSSTLSQWKQVLEWIQDRLWKYERGGLEDSLITLAFILSKVGTLGRFSAKEWQDLTHTLKDHSSTMCRG